MCQSCNQAAGRSIAILSRPVVTPSTSDLFALSTQYHSKKIPYVCAFLILWCLNAMYSVRDAIYVSMCAQLVINSDLVWLAFEDHIVKKILFFFDMM